METSGGEGELTCDKLADIYMNFTKWVKCSVFGSAVAQIKLCFTFVFSFLCVYFSSYVTQKNTKIIINAFED